MNNLSICFDARMAQASGIGTYIRGLLGEFSRQPPDELKLSLLTDVVNGVPGGWSKIPVHSRFYSPSEQWTVPQAYRRTGARWLHVPHYNLPVTMASRCIVTVHDLIHLKFPEYLPSRLAWLYAQAFFHVWI